VTLRSLGLAYFGVPYALEEIAGIESLPIIDEIIEARLMALLGLPDGDTP